MKTKTLSLQVLRKRKFLLVLPLLVLPFLTLLFWALGGGKGGDEQVHAQTEKEGLNAALPDAYLKDESLLNKLSYYEKAASDSAKMHELMKSDPYYLRHGRKAEELLQGSDSILLNNSYKPSISGGSSSLNTSPYGSNGYSDPNEAKVYKKLEELNTALNAGAARSNKVSSYADLPSNKENSINATEIDRLERLMEMTKNVDGEDPEIRQLNGMMEKILDIQHPERIKDKLRQTSESRKGQVFAVTASGDNDYSSLLEDNDGMELSSEDVKYRPSSPKNNFYSLEDETTSYPDQQNTIPAVIQETQTLVEGAAVKLRLLSDIFINGLLVPKGSFVLGLAALSGERLTIRISSARYKNTLFPVQLSVYDLDGLEGIYVPGAITRDVAKGSADRALQGISLNTLDPSIGAQAASAGIEAAKSLLSRKAKLVKVTVKAGYRVLLKDEQQKASS